ncbi:unnamed protein product [Phytomonas sp. Hart1]|nr:unnamed protein product [Phytomonas sp. Hart1]|eukprot:CCW68334.1 unnamed protein product [Phytomonas sp. isolate Hart1]
MCSTVRTNALKVIGDTRTTHIVDRIKAAWVHVQLFGEVQTLVVEYRPPNVVLVVAGNHLPGAHKQIFLKHSHLLGSSSKT